MTQMNRLRSKANRRKLARGVVSAAMLASPMAPCALGQITSTWLNTGIGYNVPANWNNGVPNANNHTAVFIGTPLNQPNLTSGSQVQVLELHSSGWVFSGSRLALNGAPPAISTPGAPTGNVTFSNALGVGANSTWTNSLDVIVNGLFDHGGGVSTARTLTLNGAPLTLNGGYALVGTGVTVTTTRTSGFAGTANVTIGSTVSNGLTAGIVSSLRSDLSGVLTLTGTNTYTGFTQLGGNGIIAFNTDASFGAVPVSPTSDNIRVNGDSNGGTLRLISGSGNVALNANRGIVVGTTTGNRTLTFDVAGSTDTLQINGPISEGGVLFGRLVKVGAGTLALNAGNSYSGSTNFSAGVIAVNHNSALGSGSVVLTSGAQLLSSNGPRTISNDIFPNGGMSIGGSENFTFTGPWTHRGSSDRTITISNLGVTTLENTVQLTSVAGENRSWTLQGTGGALTINGPINNGPAVGSININRNGLTTLNGNSSYTGTTTIANGTVRVNGTHSPAGAYTVSSGTLGGTGTIAAAVVVTDDATLAPGSSIGTLSGASLDLQADSKFVVELNFNEFVASTADQFVAQGPSAAVTLGNGSAFPQLEFVATYTGQPGNSHSFVLIQNDAVTDTTNGQFDGIAQLVTITSGYLKYTINYAGGTNGNDVVVTFSEVPEPATGVLLVGMSGLLAIRRRGNA